MIFKEISKDIREGCEILSEELKPIGENIALRGVKTPGGYYVKKHGNDVEIGYDKKISFFRALSELLTNASKADFEIAGACKFESFSVMADLSRNAVVKVDTVKRLLRKMALLGYNSLQLYTEDTFEVEGEPYFGHMRGRLRGEEIREIDAYAAMLGIELVPCIQTLAHLNQITRYYEYAAITDVSDILLAGEERTYELIEHMIKSVAENFTSRNINIGMDEAHLLGLGKYLDKHGYTSRADIMLAHLDRVGKILKKYGFKAWMWSDMFFRLVFSGEYYRADINKLPKEMLAKIPADIRLIYWDYYSLDQKQYDSMLKCHNAMSGDIAFAGGLWKWSGMIPLLSFCIEATKAAFAACADNGVKHCIMTSWGDDGGEAGLFSVIPAMWYAAALAHGETVDKSHFKAVFGMEFDEYMLLESPNFIAGNAAADQCNHSKFLLYDDVLFGTFNSAVPENANEKYRSCAEALEKIVKKGGEYAYLFDSAATLCRVLAHKAELGIRVRQAYEKKDRGEIARLCGDIDLVLADLAAFKAAYYRQWERENKPFGLEVQSIRLGGLAERLAYVKQKLSRYSDGKLDVVEELEEKALPFAFYPAENEKEVNFCFWNKIVSPGVI